MGFHGKGVQLQLSDGGATPVYTAIAEVVDIDGPGISVPIVETTHATSTAAEKKGGIPDYGEVQIEANWLPANATHDDSTGLVSILDGSTNDFKIVWPDTDATEWAFSGILSNFRPRAGTTSKLGFSATLTVDGGLTIT